MALSQSELQARIAALRKARDSGVLMVRHGDELTQFRSLAEMNAILGELEAELAGMTGEAKPRVRYITQTGKGL